MLREVDRIVSLTKNSESKSISQDWKHIIKGLKQLHTAVRDAIITEYVFLLQIKPEYMQEWIWRAETGSVVPTHIIDKLVVKKLVVSCQNVPDELTEIFAEEVSQLGWLHKNLGETSHATELPTIPVTSIRMERPRPSEEPLAETKVNHFTESHMEKPRKSEEPLADSIVEKIENLHISDCST